MKPDKRTETTMLDRRKWLKEWIELRNYDIGTRTEQFLECYHYTNRVLYSPDLSQILLCRMNEQMVDPLSEDQLSKIEASKVLKPTNQKIILWLGITDEEKEQLKIGHNMIEKEERTNRQLEAAMVVLEIENLYKAGCSIVEISKKFPDISKRTIQRYISEYRERTMTYKEKQEREKSILEMYKETTDLKKIARRKKCSVDTVRQIVNYQGMTEMTTQETKLLVSEECLFKTKEAGQLYSVSLYKTEETQSDLSEYDIALAALRTYNKAICITGAAGTGKSYLVKEFLKTLSKSERDATLIVAPTGKAADNLNAQTIHSAFQFPNEVQPNEEIAAAPKHLFGISRIIIDEVNMVRQDVFSRMIKTIQFVEEKTQKPIQVIVLGDFGQIQPVATAADMDLLKEFYPNAKGVYAFHSEQWEALNFKKIVLKHIYRQENIEFKNKLNEIKYGNIAAIQWFNENSSCEVDHNAITICPTNKLVEKHNNDAIQFWEFQDLVEFNATFVNGTTTEELPCPQNLKLAKRMRVMTICNGDKFKNGSIGTIVKLDDNSISVWFDNDVVTTITKKRFSLPDGTIYEQLPIVIAYAITANKSEGMTFDAINIVPGFFAPGQLYTALSRCRDVERIYIYGKLSTKDLHIDIEALRMTIDET